MKKIMLFVLAFVGLMMGSCTTGAQHEGPDKPVSEDGVLFKFSLPSGNEAARSMGVMPESGENKINDLTVLFFEPTTNGTGKLVGFYKTPSNLLPRQNENQFSLEIESMTGAGIVKTNPYSILALANMLLNMFDTEADLDNFLTNIAGKSENEVMNYAIMSIKGVVDDNTSMTGGIDIENIPMSAQSTKKANVDIVDVQLIRMVARFDVANATSTHEIMSVSVWNAFTQATIWEKGYMDYNQARTRRFYGRNVPANQKYMRGGIYAFPNVSTSPSQNDAKTTCLIIGMQNNISGVTTYYRVNIHSSESGQYLKRNNAYQVTIQGVSGVGESSEVNAYAQGKVLLDVSINSWDRDEDGLIIRDGDNLLAIPTRKARFSPEAETRQYFVYTLGTGELELTKLDMPTGMDAWLGGEKNNDLFISVTDYTFDQRKGSIELRFAGMKGVVEIIQSGATEKSLKLSHTTVPAYPAGKRTDMVGANPILINSSGPWTAEIFGTDFSFNMDDATDNKLRGIDGGHINNIYNNAINSNVQSKTNFVLITLDEDPDNYRNVLVLTQLGTGGFTLTPNNTTVQFEANMAASPTGSNVFALRPGSVIDDTWTVGISGANAEKFSVAVTDATLVDTDLWKGNGAITITANETNYTGTYTATMKITHNGLNTKEINVTQDFYNLKAILISTVPILETGGSKEVRIATDASQPLAWTAKLEGIDTLNKRGFTPFFIGEDGKPIMDGANYAASISGMTGVFIKIGMIGINQDIRALNGGAPEATLNVVLTDKPAVTATPLVIKQDPVKYYNIYAQNLTATYGNWAATDGYFTLFRNELMSAANFGPTGASKVYARITPNILDAPSYTVFNNNTGDNRKRIIHANGNGYLGANTTDWATFRKNPYVVFLMNEHATFANQVFNNTGFGGLGFNIVPTNVPISYQRKITTESRTVNSEIYKFLIGGDGPFGEVNANAFVVNSFDGTNCTLLDGAWPNTFIPLIRHSVTNNCILGIDPTLRMIWVGDTEILTKLNATQPNNNSADAMAFMRNLQAWMIMTANYGDSFNERFKIK